MLQIWTALEHSQNNLEDLKSMLWIDIREWNAQHSSSFNEQSVIQLPTLFHPLPSTPSDSTNYSELVNSANLVEETVSHDYEQ